jgi:hypothetical protein
MGRVDDLHIRRCCRHSCLILPNIKARTGSVPTIRYFDLTMIVDNEAGSVIEFPPAAQAAE